MTKPHYRHFDSQEEFDAAWDAYEEDLIDRAEEEKLERMLERE